MLKRFAEHTRCPESLIERALVGELDGISDGGWSSDGSEKNGAAMAAPPRLDGGTPTLIQRFLNSDGDGSFPSNLDEMVDYLRLEKYVDDTLPEKGHSDGRFTAREIYYLLRPFFPVAFRKHLQRFALRDWHKRSFPAWPVDFTVEDIFEKTFRFLARTLDISEVPFIWYWPDGYSACCVMTHDVETKTGRDFCGTMMKMEADYGFRSSFELVPEKRYEVPMEFLEQIRQGGCEICVHGLNHDGKLFSSESVFFERARKINKYAEQWGATGFRSPVMYRNLNWFRALNLSYEMSVPNVGHLDPQRGGCCTVIPYFIGDILELPLTTIQDYPLYHILKERSLDLWKEQSETILRRHGFISFIIHPDYTTARWSKQLYQSLLEYLARLRADRNVWTALPGEVNTWWRTRHEMKLINDDGHWRIHGAGAERARVAYASIENGDLIYKVEPTETVSANL